MCVHRNDFPVSQAKATDIQGARSTMFKHLLAISLGHKTDFQQPSLPLPPISFFFSPCPVSSPSLIFQFLCSPPIFLSLFLPPLLLSLHPLSLHFLSPSLKLHMVSVRGGLVSSGSGWERDDARKLQANTHV